MKQLLIGLAGVGCTGLGGCVTTNVETASNAPEVIYDKEPGAGLGLPFSPAVVAGDLIFLSGALGIEPGSRSPVEGGVGAETTQIFDNIETVLARQGADLSHIVKCTVFLEDMEEYGAMNQAYMAALPDPKPARSTFGVDGIALGASLEIECIAVRPK